MVSTNYIFVPDAFVQRMTPKSLVSVICGNLRNLRFTSIFGFRVNIA